MPLASPRDSSEKSPCATCIPAASSLDIPESLAQVRCRYIKGRKGHLFTTRAGRLLDSRNVLDVLQQAGRQGGYHAFPRFRFAVLRKAGVPDDLIKLKAGERVVSALSPR